MTNYRVIKYKNWTIMGGTSVGWQILHPPYDEYYWKINSIRRMMMTINKALQIIDDVGYNPDDIEWQEAFNKITETIGVYWDRTSGNFVTKDTGDVI